MADFDEKYNIQFIPQGSPLQGEQDVSVREFERELDMAEDRHRKNRCFISESMDETARQWGVMNNTFSKRDDREYASYIFETSNGLYRTFQNPVVGDIDGFLVSDLDERKKDEGLEDLKVVGIIHSHGAENPGYDSEDFSSSELDENGYVHGDLILSEMTGLPIFLISPRDTLRKYTPKQYLKQKWFVGEK